MDEWLKLELRCEVGTKLDWARTRERIMELEIALIEDHGLTLPPSTAPIHSSEKSSYPDWRRRTLEDLRKERAWLQVGSRLRRVLTFGLWREYRASGAWQGCESSDHEDGARAKD